MRDIKTVGRGFEQKWMKTIYLLLRSPAEISFIWRCKVLRIIVFLTLGTIFNGILAACCLGMTTSIQLFHALFDQSKPFITQIPTSMPLPPLQVSSTIGETLKNFKKIQPPSWWSFILIKSIAVLWHISMNYLRVKVLRVSDFKWFGPGKIATHNFWGTKKQKREFANFCTKPYLGMVPRLFVWV